MFSKFLATAVAAVMLSIGFSTVHAQDGATTAAATRPAAEKVAFLGVVTSDVPDILRAQLNLPKGFGMVIDSVEPGSPAEQAGLKRYDVLDKINDQIIINREQLAVLIASYKPGDAIPVTVIHLAQPTTLSIKLAAKPAAIALHPRTEEHAVQRPGDGHGGSAGRVNNSRPGNLMRQRGFGGPQSPVRGTFDRNTQPRWMAFTRGEFNRPRMRPGAFGPRAQHDGFNRGAGFMGRGSHNTREMSDRRGGFGPRQQLNRRETFDRRGESEQGRNFNPRAQYDRRDGDREDDGANARHSFDSRGNDGFDDRDSSSPRRANERGNSYHSDARNAPHDRDDGDREDADRDDRDNSRGPQFDRRQGLHAGPPDDRQGDRFNDQSDRRPDQRDMNSNSRNYRNDPQDDSNGGGRSRGMFRGGPMQGPFNMRSRGEDGRRPGPSTRETMP